MKTNKAHKEIASVIEIHRNKPMVSSLKIADIFERRHDSVLRAIRTVLIDGRGLRISAETSLDIQGKERPVYWLGEREALVIMPYIGGKKSMEGQERLVDAYLYYRDNFANPPRTEYAAEKRESHHVMMENKRFVLEDIMGLETTRKDFIKENLFCNRALTGMYKELDESTLDNYDMRLLSAIRNKNATLILRYPRQKEPATDGKSRYGLMEEFVADYRAKHPRFKLAVDNTRF